MRCSLLMSSARTCCPIRRDGSVIVPFVVGSTVVNTHYIVLDVYPSSLKVVVHLVTSQKSRILWSVPQPFHSDLCPVLQVQ